MKWTLTFKIIVSFMFDTLNAYCRRIWTWTRSGTLTFYSTYHQRWAWDGTVSEKDFVRGTWVPRLGISELCQRFLFQFKESKGFVSHETTLGQPEFLGLHETWVQGTVPEIRNVVPGHKSHGIPVPLPIPRRVIY